MELKVWVEGIQRVVCGVSETTTCQDVVYALAHATGKTGRFTLIEKWRNSERLLAPSEFPRKILYKWGEYSPDVQFILQRTALEPKQDVKSTKTVHNHGSSSSSSESPKTTNQSSSHKQGIQLGTTNRDIKKSLTFSGAHAAQSLVAKEQNESCGEVGFHGAPKEFHTLPPDDTPFPIHPNNRLPYTRPLAPPPYEVVKGIPPPPVPSHQSMATNHYKYASRANEINANPVRVPPPYSRASQFSKVRLAQPPMNNLRGLPPYRNPPPPPIPSHPSLLKLTMPSIPQANPEIINYQVSSIDTSLDCRPHVLHNDISAIVAKSQNDVQEFSRVYTTAKSNFNPNTSQNSSDSIHHKKLKQNSSSSLRNSGNSAPSKVKVTSSVEFCQPLPQSFKDKNNRKSPNNVESFAKTQKIDRISHSDANRADKYECSSKINGFVEVRDADVKVSGDINDNVLASPTVVANRKQNGTEDGINELYEEMTRREIVNHNSSLDGRVEKVVVDAYYKKLVKLVNKQREKLSSQQVDLTKYEAEIAYMDGRWREDESMIKYLQSEIQQIEKTKQIEFDPEEIKKLENQFEMSQESENSVKLLLSQLQEKYTNSQNTLAQLGSKASSLEKQLNSQLEAKKRSLAVENEEEELAILREIEKLQKAVLQANKQVQSNEEISNSLSDEISELEELLDAKRNEIDALRQLMKEANLEALTMTPPDESKQSPEGSWKSGTSRVMKGSPRQLETAVPTSKNPHGVWV